MGQGASLACFSGGNGLHSAILEGEDGFVKQVSSLGSVFERFGRLRDRQLLFVGIDVRRHIS